MDRGGCRVQFRLDGMLTQVGTLPIEAAKLILGRVKYLAKLKTYVESLAFAPDSSQLATGSRDSRVRLHSIEGRLLRTFQGVGEPPDATGFGQTPRVLCLDWSRAGLIGGTSSGYVFRLPIGQGNWQSLHREKADPVYSLGQTPDEIVAGKNGQVLKLPKPAK